MHLPFGLARAGCCRKRKVSNIYIYINMYLHTYIYNYVFITISYQNMDSNIYSRTSSSSWRALGGAEKDRGKRHIYM